MLVKCDYRVVIIEIMRWMALCCQKYRESVAKVCVRMHESIVTANGQFWDELRRYNYVTPSSYMELISVYTRLVTTSRTQILGNKYALYCFTSLFFFLCWARSVIGWIESSPWSATSGEVCLYWMSVVWQKIAGVVLCLLLLIKYRNTEYSLYCFTCLFFYMYLRLNRLKNSVESSPRSLTSVELCI